MVAALLACAGGRMRPKVRRFLVGLSCDELQFIAEYLGSCILESLADCGHCRGGLTERIDHLPRPRMEPRFADRELKAILLREYLCRAGVQDLPVSPRTRQAVPPASPLPYWTAFRPARHPRPEPHA